jgi:arylsulfatase A-like enzyme
MRKTVIITGLVVVVVIAAALAFRQKDIQSSISRLETPDHYFFPSTSPSSDIISCDFTNDRDRSTMPDLWQLSLQPCSLGLGWTYPSPGGVLSLARTGTFDIDLPNADWTTLVLEVKSFEASDDGRPQTLSLVANGQPVGSIEVPEAWGAVGLPVPSGVLHQGVNHFSASFGYRVSPERKGRKKDGRLFAVHLRDLALVRAPESESLEKTLKRSRKSSGSRAIQDDSLFDHRNHCFVLSRPGTLVLPTDIPDDADRLQLEIETQKPGGRNDLDIDLTIHSPSTGATQKMESAGATTSDYRGSRVFEASVGEFSGTSVFITVDVPSHPEPPTLVVSPPLIYPRSISSPAGESADEVVASSVPAPDIILITLDAARAGHFSCYGYDRPTTPNIDRLAQDSLVFRNAFALAPYTLCSVPTMLTGLSFLDHQVTSHGEKLTDQATTLAEYLKAAGYTTACFTASPNNSMALGTNQGYDTFVESWKTLPRNDSSDPFLLARMAVQWLSEHDGPTPLHLQLHFVPPHAPYEPGPEFDRFTDPSYTGRCDGDHITITALDTQRWIASTEDLAEVVGLYDGNLLKADAAVSQVLGALRHRARWPNTVVLVTADHGEAFLEHGRMSHNSTVFDEMLHVPLIIRLPERFHGQHQPLDSLVTLADIVPTLLATAALEPEPGLAGINLLNRAADGYGTHGRYLVARTTGDQPLYGLRTLQWKLMLSGSGQGSLFNLERDPGEDHDLALEERAVFYSLGRLLTGRISEAPRFEPAVNLERVSDEDAEMLKALGYAD